MNKKLISILMILFFSFGAFAQDNSADTAPAQTEAKEAPDAVSSATKPQVKVGIAFDIKDKNYVYTEGEDGTNKQNFDKYRNKANLQAGLLVNINDKIILNPYVRAHDMDFRTYPITTIKTKQYDATHDVTTVQKTSDEKTFKFNYGAIKTGLSTSIDACDFLSLGFNLFQWTYFTRYNPLWVGLGYRMSLEFSFDKAFFDFYLTDEISVRFAEVNNQTNSYLLNLFDYGFQFNVFNFINPKAKTGIYGDGEFEINFQTKDGQYDFNRLYNEFYFGVKSSPLPFLEFWMAYFVNGECKWNQDFTRVGETGYFEMGFETGATFKYNGFSAQFSYEPKLFSMSDAGVDNWQVQPIYQSFSVTLGYKFKTYFQNK